MKNKEQQIEMLKRELKRIEMHITELSHEIPCDTIQENIDQCDKVRSQLERELRELEE